MPDDIVDRFQVVPAAYVVFRRLRSVDSREREEVLLQFRRGTGYMDEHWACAAAGHVEAGEPVSQAALREVREELGLVVEQHDLIPITAMHRTAGNGHAIDERVDFFFECRTWLGEERIVEPDKAAELAWFPLDRLPEPVVPHELEVLTRLANGSMAPVIEFGFAEH